MNCLSNKNILLAVTGGIAAYKSCELLRRMRDNGADVRVVMTESATKFVTPLTFQALSGHRVHTTLLDEEAEAAMGHIELARWADCILIAPASANSIAKIANGIADDLLSTLVLASAAPLYVAPAMNQQMWLAQATIDNIQLLKHRGVQLLGPGTGDQACGDYGPGRMMEVSDIILTMNQAFQSGSLSGHKILITAGPTREAIDPVRYISNHSSGKMGYAIARAAAEAGADVTLISGPTQLTVPENVSLIAIESANEMYEAVMRSVDDKHIFISAAAVADYSIADISAQKIKKQAGEMTLTLSKTADILAQVSQHNQQVFTVGFAAETEQLKEHALGKLKNKKLDMIAANLVGNGLGFNSDENALQVFWPGGDHGFELASKEKLARQLIDLIARRYEEKYSNQDTGSPTRH